jgi:hypothetical protein
VQDLVPQLPWKEVVKELDNVDFFIKDKSSLRLLVQALKKVLKEPFPIDYLYRVWKNMEGQVSLFMYFLQQQYQSSYINNN